MVGGNYTEYAADRHAADVYIKGGSGNPVACYGTVDSVTVAPTFTSADLAGYGNDYFEDWYVYVVWDKGGLGAAPQSEHTQITGYTSSTGAFAHAAFTQPLVAGDKVIIQLANPAAAGGDATAANQTLILADIGDASASTLLSLYGILGNPSASLASTILDDIDGRANNANLNALLGVADAAGRSINGNIGDYQAQVNLQTLLAALGIPDVAAKPLYTCLVTDRLDHATYGLSALDTELALIPQSGGAVSWNATALAAIQGEAEDAIEGENLDHIAAVTTVAADMTAEVVDGSVISRMLSKTSDTSTYNPTTDAQEMLSDKLGGFTGDGGADQNDSTKSSLDLAHTDLDTIIEDTATLLQKATKSITLSTAAVPVTETLFTVTGVVEVIFLGYITTTVQSAGALKLRAGIASVTDGLIIATPVIQLVAGRVWKSATASELEYLPSTMIIGNGADIIHTITDADATAGAVTYYCWWRPISSDGNVVAA